MGCHSQNELERVTGIEPAPSAWKAEALPLSYTRAERPVYGGPRRAIAGIVTHLADNGPATIAGGFGWRVVLWADLMEISSVLLRRGSQ